MSSLMSITARGWAKEDDSHGEAATPAHAPMHPSAALCGPSVPPQTPRDSALCLPWGARMQGHQFPLLLFLDPPTHLTPSHSKPSLSWAMGQPSKHRRDRPFLRSFLVTGGGMPAPSRGLGLLPVSPTPKCTGGGELAGQLKAQGSMGLALVSRSNIDASSCSQECVT